MLLEVPPPFQETHGTHKVIPHWLTERFSRSSQAPARVFRSRWFQGSSSPSIPGSTKGPSSLTNHLPIRSIRSPKISYVVPPSRTTTQNPSNSVYQTSSSPFSYDLVETGKGKLQGTENVKGVEKTIVEVKILKSNNRAMGQRRVCAASM